MDNKGIVLKNINKVYPGTQALKDFDFTLTSGEVHCLVGENGSGKSTFIKILSGVETPEPGAEIWIDGELSTNHNSTAALNKGIHVIYQDMSLFPNLTVAENIAFTSNSGNGFINWKKNREIALTAMEELGISIDPDKKVESLSIAQQQLVEISRSIKGSLKLLILDEPTASLTQKEVNALFNTIHRLKDKGVSILFVSHKMNEIFRIAEKITVLRDGDKIGEFNTSELNHDKLVYYMSGQKTVINPPKPINEDSRRILEVKNLTKKSNYKGISLSLKEGEILGITGLLGSGRTELALSLFGMNKPDSGEILINGSKIELDSNKKALLEGICYVPEDRHHLGLIMNQSIENNLTVTVLNEYINKYGFLDESKRRQNAEKQVDDFGIKISSVDDAIETLSGGNQQKVVLSKWLSVVPKVLILDEPTIGIDVVAKNSIHSLIKTLAENGMSIIIISDEIAEVFRNSHRVLVMQYGRIINEFDPLKEDEEKILNKYNLG